MKKIFTLAIGAMLAGCAWASETESCTPTVALNCQENKEKATETVTTHMQSNQETDNTWERNNFVSFNYGEQTLKLVDNLEKQKSDYAVGLTWIPGHIKFHEKPLGNVLMLGLDIGLDLSFAQYTTNEEKKKYRIGGSSNDKIEYLKLLQGEAGLAIGPCMKIAPLAPIGQGWQYLRLLTYWHMTPSASAIASSEFEHASVAFNFFNKFGFGLAYKVISIGYEYRFGEAKYKDIVKDYEEDNHSDQEAEKIKLKTTSNRVFLRLNF